MAQKPNSNVKKNIANFFGSLGYLFSFLQWFWGIILYVSLVKSLDFLIPANSNPQIVQPSNATISLPDPVQAIILGIIVVTMVAVSIYGLIQVPKSIIKTGNKAVNKSAESIAPLIIRAQHSPNTKKTRTLISTRVIIVLKIILILAPLALAFGSGLLETQAITYQIAYIVGISIAVCSGISFALQYLVAAALRIRLSQLW